MTVPEALQDRQLRRFRLRRHRLSVAGGQLSVVAPARADDLLDGGGAARYLRTGFLPYWADIWPASVGLARRLMRGPDLVGQQVLDLGCGIGLPGLAAGRKGGLVRFVDREIDALNFARFNARKNGLRDFETSQLDWFAGTEPGSFDLLLLADVSYERRNFEPLLRHLDRCLAPGGTAWVADPFRAAANDFLALLEQQFVLNIDHTDTHFAGERVALRLVQVRKPPA